MELHLALDMTAKLALIVGAGIGAQWLGWRLQWPAIVLMSIAGLMLGPLSALVLGEPLIAPARDFGEVLRPAIALAVAVILFEGGLGLHFAEIRATSGAVIRLVIFGAPLGWLLGTGTAYYVAGLPWDLSALLGGLLVVTGPTVIIPLLRQARLSARPASVLKWEGIINDPLGAVFAVLIFEFITLGGQIAGGHDGGRTGAAIVLVLAVAAGVAVGIAAGFALAASFRRGWVPEYLKAPLMLVTVMGVYVFAEQIAHETGLVAVTALGVTLANIRFAAIEELRRFKEGIAILLVSGLFVTLTAGLQPAEFAAFDWRVLAFVGAMLFVVRPLVVWISTFGSELNWRETLLIGWIAPRGIVAVAVAGYFATQLAAQGRADASALTTLVFAMVFATVVLHGFSITPLSRLLGLSRAGPEGLLLVGANPWTIALAKALGEAEVPVILADQSWQSLRPARLAGITVFHGEILSESAEEKLDHAQISSLLAASSNEAYNALVCVEFAPELGRHRVFQLSAYTENEDNEKGIAFTARGRTAIERGRAWNSLIQNYWQGWRFHNVTLSETLNLDTMRVALPEGSNLVAERGPNGALSLLGPSKPAKGGVGAQIIVFAPGEKLDLPQSEPESDAESAGPDALQSVSDSATKS